MRFAQLFLAIATLVFAYSPVHGQGADVIVGDITGPSNHGSTGSIQAYSLGTTSCNIGDVPLLWIANNNQHPVIGGSLYRIKDGKFDQIGMSWLKHGFTALQGTLCGPCNANPNGSALGVGCSDPYSSGLNGSQGGLGPRSEVNATTGAYPYPWINDGTGGTNNIFKRLQAHHADVDPAQNSGAIYVSEAQYVTADDSAALNHHNNCSYRRVNINGSMNMSFNGGTVRELTAIESWPTFDPSVQLNEVIIENGRYILGSRVEDLGNGFWFYSYALFNMNSDRSGQSFSIPLPAGVSVQNTSFHDVDYHSGEPYSGTDWPVTVNAASATWETQTFATNANANALRWSTTYSFSFEANVAPGPGSATVGLFKPGTGNSFTITTQVPDGQPVDPTDPVTGLSCSDNYFEANLSWNNADVYDSIDILRDGAVIASLAGSATSFSDSSLAVGTYAYGVRATISGVDSALTNCNVTISPLNEITNLNCVDSGSSVSMTWINGESYISIQIRRNGILIQTIAGNDTSYVDNSAPVGNHDYTLTGLQGGGTTNGTICNVTVDPPPPLAFDFIASSSTLNYDSVTGVGSSSIAISVLEDSANNNFPNEFDALSVGVGHNQNLLQASSVQLASAMSTLNAGQGPDFFNPALENDGVSAGIVFSFNLDSSLTASAQMAFLNINYDTVPASLAGNNTGTSTTLAFADGQYGSPTVLNGVVVGIEHISPAFTNGTMTLNPVVTVQEFIRGDIDGNGSVNLSDIILALNYLFGTPGTFNCQKAIDFNDDSNLDISDPVIGLDFLFLSGPNLSAPFPSCGVDPTADSLDCLGPVTACP